MKNHKNNSLFHYDKMISQTKPPGRKAPEQSTSIFDSIKAGIAEIDKAISEGVKKEALKQAKTLAKSSPNKTTKQLAQDLAATSMTALLIYGVEKLFNKSADLKKTFKDTIRVAVIDSKYPKKIEKFQKWTNQNSALFKELKIALRYASQKSTPLSSRTKLILGRIKQETGLPLKVIMELTNIFTDKKAIDAIIKARLKPFSSLSTSSLTLSFELKAIYYSLKTKFPSQIKKFEKWIRGNRKLIPEIGIINLKHPSKRDREIIDQIFKATGISKNAKGKELIELLISYMQKVKS